MERTEFYSALYDSNNYLEHHGVKGQKWGVRRYQNPDGTLTPLGIERLRKTNKDDFVDAKYQGWVIPDNEDRVKGAVHLAVANDTCPWKI